MHRNLQVELLSDRWRRGQWLPNSVVSGRVQLQIVGPRETLHLKSMGVGRPFEPSLRGDQSLAIS